MRCEVDGTAPGLLWVRIFRKVEEMQLKGFGVRLSKTDGRSVAFERFKPVGLKPRLVTLFGDIPAKELVVTGLEAGDLGALGHKDAEYSD